MTRRDAKLTPAALIDAQARGLSGAELAREVGVAQTSVWAAKQRHGIVLALKRGTASPHVWSAAHVRLLLDMRAAGAKWTDVGVAVGRAWKACAKQGSKMRRAGIDVPRPPRKSKPKRVKAVHVVRPAAPAKPMNPLAALTPDQRADYATLLRYGGYSQDEALRMVTQPRRKMTARPPSAGPRA